MSSAVRFAQVEPTTRCNFTCGFCCGRRMDQTDLPLATFEAFLNSVPGLEYLELQGEGEPLMHPEFFDMVALATARGIQTSIITNGSLFSASVVEKILDSGITSLRISTETHDAARFASIRGGSWARVQAGIERLLARRAERGLQRPSVGLSVTVLASTLDDLPGVFALYEQLGLDGGIAIQPLNRMPGYAQGYPAPFQHEFLQRERHEASYLRHMGSEAHQRIARQVASSAFSSRHFYEHLFQPSPEEQAQGRLSTCPWLARGLYMDRHGHLAPCCMVKDPAASFATLGQASMPDVLAQRNAMALALAQGETPAPCLGCNVARAIVQGRGAMAQARE